MSKGGITNVGGGIRLLNMPGGTDVSPAVEGVIDLRAIDGVLKQSIAGAAWATVGAGGNAWSAETVLGAPADFIDIACDSSLVTGIQIVGTIVTTSTPTDRDFQLQPGGLTGAFALVRNYTAAEGASVAMNSKMGAGPPDLTRNFITRAGASGNRVNNVFNLTFEFPGANQRWFKCHTAQFTSGMATSGGEVYDVSGPWTDGSAFTTVRIGTDAGTGMFLAGTKYRYRFLA